MAYLAMARKWRPKNFEDMVGQDHIAQTIRNAIEGKRISHAYLFTGTRGVGKTTSARILAKALNCKNGPTPVPCETCENCKAVNNGSSLDVLEIDGASNNGVDNIRELREQANYAPMNGIYKIYVIDEVHMLSKGAFNALLKTLEEPPPHVVFIFATTESNKVPNTILSRVQRFDFKRISEEHIRGRLEYICAQEGIKAEREALEAVSRKADGSMRDALSLFDQVYAYSGADFTLEAARKVLGLPRDALFDGLLRALIQHDQKTCFSSVQEAHQEGIETQALLIGFGEYLRNMLFARQGVSPAALGLGEQRYAELVSLAPELRDGDIIRYAKMVSDILAQLKNSANPRLAVELGFARMAALDRVVTLSQVLGQDFAPAPAQPARATEHATDLSEVKKKSPADAVTVQAPAQAPSTPSKPAAAVPPAAPSVPAPATAFAPVMSAPAAPMASVAAASATATLSAAAEAAPKPSAPDAATTVALREPPGAAEATKADFAAPVAATVATAAADTAFAAVIAAASEAMVSAEDAMAVLAPAAPAESRPRPAGPEPEDAPSDLSYGTEIDPGMELERDPEPDLDPEDPEAPRIARPAEAEGQDSLTVAEQDSPARLPEVWTALVQEFMALKPLSGAHLARTRLEWEPGDSPTLRVTFLERGAFSAAGEDADFRKAVQSFLASKVAGRKESPVRFALDKAAADAGAAEAIPVPFAKGNPEDREPIIGFIQDLFEARTIK
jgi:DNA polymerase III subunit gamma/tau